MGGQTYTDQDWGSLNARATAAAAPTSNHTHTYTSSQMKDAYNPAKIVVRESRHSDVNPQSTPIILGCDVTGSMQDILHSMISTTCPVLMKEIFDRKPVTDPHIMFAGIGDAYCDDAPLQVTQFEGNIKAIDQLQEIWLEQGGGGNNSEGYNLLWHFAAYKTSCDAIEKDGRKGFLFSFGDDGPTPNLTPAILEKVYGNNDQILATNAELLQRLQSMYHVFHITLSRGWRSPDVIARWNDVLGERHLVLDDHTKMGEIIVSTMQLISGTDLDTVAKSWSGDTALVVAKTLGNVGAVATRPGDAGVVVRL